MTEARLITAGEGSSDKQKGKAKRILCYWISQHHQYELMFSLMYIEMKRYRNNYRYVYIYELVYIHIFPCSVC